MKTGGQQAATGAVFEPVQQVAQHPKTRRHQAAGVARMHTFSEHLNLERAAGHAAQAAGQPKLVVIAGTRVQANHQAHITQALAQQVNVGHQVIRAAFFTGFNQPHDARVRRVLGFECLNGGDGGVNGVAVVGTTAAIQLAVFVFRRPRPQVTAPAGEFRLLVQVAVHQHGLI